MTEQRVQEFLGDAFIQPFTQCNVHVLHETDDWEHVPATQHRIEHVTRKRDGDKAVDVYPHKIHFTHSRVQLCRNSRRLVRRTCERIRIVQRLMALGLDADSSYIGRGNELLADDAEPHSPQHRVHIRELLY